MPPANAALTLAAPPATTPTATTAPFWLVVIAGRFIAKLGIVIRVINLTIIFHNVIRLVGFLRLTMILTAVLTRL